jgi:hypothetical protein
MIILGACKLCKEADSLRQREAISWESIATRATPRCSVPVPVPE